VDSPGNVGWPNAPVAGSNPPISSSQMAELFYGQLGQVQEQSIATTNNGAAGYNLFSNLQANAYWSGTKFSLVGGEAWGFDTSTGYQRDFVGSDQFYALAVAPGKVNAPMVLLAALLKEVTGVGPGKSLANKVTAAQAYYAASDTQATCAMLTGFVNEVQAQDGKKIDPTLDAKLIADADAIEAAIGCN